MVASFHAREESAAFDAVPTRGGVDPSTLDARPSPFLVEVRELTPTRIGNGQVRHSDSLWVRASTPLPDDPLIHACAVAYVSDLGSGFGQVQVPDLPAGGPSIDHSLWFHEPIRADEWMLLELWPLKASGSRGVYSGSLRAKTGASVFSSRRRCCCATGSSNPRCSVASPNTSALRRSRSRETHSAFISPFRCRPSVGRCRSVLGARRPRIHFGGGWLGTLTTASPISSPACPSGGTPAIRLQNCQLGPVLPRNPSAPLCSCERSGSRTPVGVPFVGQRRVGGVALPLPRPPARRWWPPVPARLEHRRKRLASPSFVSCPRCLARVGVSVRP